MRASSHKIVRDNDNFLGHIFCPVRLWFCRSHGRSKHCLRRFSITSCPLIFQDIRFDAYRGPGWVLVALSVVTLYIILMFGETYEAGVLEASRESQQPPSSTSCFCEIPPEVNKVLLFAVVLLFFAFSIGLGLNETILTPLARDSFGMSIQGSIHHPLLTTKATSSVFLAGGATNAVGFPILILLQKYYPRKVTSIRVTFFALFLCIASSLIWTDWNSIIYDDPCQDFTCTYSLNSSIVCPTNHTMEACHSFSTSCVWMKNGTHGLCPDCPPVCRDPGLFGKQRFLINTEKSLSIYQFYVGNMLLAVGFTMGRAASSGFYSELLQGRAQGFLMGLIIAVGSVARIVAPLVGVYVYELVNSTYLLMPAVTLLYITTGSFLLITYIKTQNLSTTTSSNSKDI